jgi:hypothetical protein
MVVRLYAIRDERPYEGSNVACTAVTMQRPRDKANKQRPFLGKHVPAATNMQATIEERYFLCDPSRDVITRTAGAMRGELSSAREPEKNGAIFHLTVQLWATTQALKLKNLHC